MDYEPIPFYMAYPLPLYMDEEVRMAREAEYLKSMYPEDARKIEKVVQNAMEILDYDQSMIYDEYPDKIMMYRLMQTIYEQLKDMEDTKSKKDLVDVLVIQEVIRRRTRLKEKKYKF